MQTIIRITQGTPRKTEWRLAQPVDFELHAGEHIAIIGANGSGKSMLVDMITGKHPLLHNQAVYNFAPSTKEYVADNIKLVAFKDSYGENNATYFLQQRWNQQEMDEDIATVEEVLNRYGGKAESLGFFPVSILRSPIVLLSSGEMRKLEIAKALLAEPRVLVIDNPYIGLDAAAREMLTSVLETLSHQLTLVVLASRAQDIPYFIQSGVWVEDGLVGPRLSTQELTQHERTVSAVRAELPEAAAEVDPEQPACDELVGFDHITIRYGQRTILDNLSWQVNRGEHWALTGENGVGKSTLLSLVCADNPQAYACNITLFGHRRGRGESIWDIKRHIGYVSPEMFSTYRKSLPAIDIVASGLHDTIGLYRRISDEERAACAEWMRAFGASHLAGRNYLQLSSGEQRLILLVRAFVKHPALLILDEPFHGLDARSRERARQLIDAYMALPGKTLVMVTHYPEELPYCIDHHLHLTKH